MEKNTSAVSLGKLGGEATKRKLGVEHYKRINALSQAKRKKHVQDS